MTSHPTSSPGLGNRLQSSLRVPPVGSRPLRRRLRAWRHWHRNRRHLERARQDGSEVVLIHQMGKVGSSSVKETLQHVTGITPIQTHWCNADNLAHPAGIINEKRRVSNRYGDRDHFGLMVHDRIIRTRAASKVITMFRDPVARNVSSYFQHLDEIWGVRQAHRRISINELQRGFHETFEHDEPINWFNTEIRDVFGIDLFDHRFDHRTRWSQIDTRHWSVLVMRSDLTDAGKQQAVSSLLGHQIPALQRSNVGENKLYAEAYREFKSQICLSPDYLDRLYDTPVVRHFFSSEEIRSLRSRWMRG